MGSRQLLHRWEVDVAAQRAGANQVDYRALLSWCRRYRARLDEHEWIDRAELEAALAPRATAGRKLVVADVAESHSGAHCVVRAARRTWHGDRGDHGAARDRHAARRPTRRRRGRAACGVRLGEAASRRRGPRARIAVVVPGGARRPDEIERAAAAELGALAPHAWWAEGRSRHTIPRSAPRATRWLLPARMRHMRSSAVGCAARSSSRRAPSRSRARASTRSCAASCARSFRFKPPIVAA